MLKNQLQQVTQNFNNSVVKNEESTNEVVLKQKNQVLENEIVFLKQREEERKFEEENTVEEKLNNVQLQIADLLENDDLRREEESGLSSRLNVKIDE